MLEGIPEVLFYVTPPSEVRFLSHAFAGRSSVCIVELELVAYKSGRKEDQGLSFDCNAKRKAHYRNIGTNLLQIGLDIVDETLPESLIAEFNSWSVMW